MSDAPVTKVLPRQKINPELDHDGVWFGIGNSRIKLSNEDDAAMGSPLTLSVYCDDVAPPPPGP